MAQGTFKKSSAPSFTKPKSGVAAKKVFKNKVQLQTAKLSKKLLGQSVVYTEKLLAPKAAATGKLTILKSLAKPADAGKGKKKGKGRM